MSITTVIGRLTSDPELTFSQQGKAQAKFSIAENHSRKNQQTGQWEEIGATFYRVTLWEHHAEQAAEQLRKGMRVIAHGRTVTRKYTTKDGTEGTSFELNVDDIGPAIDKYPPKGQQQAAQQNNAGWGAQPPAQDPWGAGQPQGGGWDAPTDKPAF